MTTSGPAVSIVVPYRAGGCTHREAAWDYVSARYTRLHPGWELLVGDIPGEWSKGAAVDEAFTRSAGDVVVVADADSFVDADILELAVAAAAVDGWAVPHRKVRRLHERATTGMYLDGRTRPQHLIRPAYTGPAGGGIVAVTRSAYETVGGIDDRFIGWGGEDLAFGWALETLVGPGSRLGGVLWHLWHPHPAPSHRGRPESESLAAAYKAARHIPRLMRALVDRTDPPAPAVLERPAVFTSASQNRKVFRARRAVACFADHRFETVDADLADLLRVTEGVEEVSECPQPR